MKNLFLNNTFLGDPLNIVIIGMFVLLGLMLYFGSRRRRAMQSQVNQMHEQLRPGQRVRTVGGVVGRIKEIREEAPEFKTVLIQTGNDKHPAYMLFDIQAIYGIVPEEGHSISGAPLGPVVSNTNAESTINGKHIGGVEPSASSIDIDAREYVDKRNSIVGKSSSKIASKKTSAKKK